MGLINLGAGLSAMGESIAHTAGVAGLEAQRSQLETQKLQLAQSMRLGEQDREFAHADARTDKEISARSAETDKEIGARKDLADSAARREAEEKNTAPISDVAKLQADLKAGRISQEQFDAAFAKATYEPDGTSEPLVEVSDGKGGTIYTPRSQAAGKPGKPEKPDKLSVTDVIAPILQKMSNGTPLTTGESAAWEAYTKLDPIKKIMVDAIKAAGEGGGLEDKPPGAAPAPAKVPAAKPPKPTGEYSDAQWSDKYSAWVVIRNGKPFAVEK